MIDVDQHMEFSQPSLPNQRLAGRAEGLRGHLIYAWAEMRCPLTAAGWDTIVAPDWTRGLPAVTADLAKLPDKAYNVGRYSCQIRARTIGPHRGVAGSLGKSISIRAGSSVPGPRIFRSAPLTVWGSGVRVPSAPPVMTSANAEVNSFLPGFRSS